MFDIIGPQLPHEWRNNKEFFGEETDCDLYVCVFTSVKSYLKE